MKLATLFFRENTIGSGNLIQKIGNLIQKIRFRSYTLNQGLFLTNSTSFSHKIKVTSTIYPRSTTGVCVTHFRSSEHILDSTQAPVRGSPLLA